MKEKELEELFRSRFNTAEETPNPSVWNNIEQALDQTPVVPIRKKNKTWRYASVAAAAVIALTIGYTQLTNTFHPEQHTEYAVLPKSTVHPTEDQMSSLMETPKTTAHTPTEVAIASRPTIAALTPAISHTPAPQQVISEVVETLELAEKAPREPHSAINTQHIQTVPTELSIIQVTEIEDLKPLVPVDEELESLYASTATSTSTSNVVTTLLNKITENIDVLDSKNLRFSADEEGSIRLDIINSLVKNRFKKRK